MHKIQIGHPVRIVSGLAKGRRLAAPAKGTRPTSDQAREAMFNTLAGTLQLDGARVLDLFAGTGAVGLEALSRGAAEAVFVEKNRPSNRSTSCSRTRRTTSMTNGYSPSSWCLQAGVG
jgi:16S rRNA (guanine(966)-N(2))-methyltransferase RsmD